MLVTDRRRGGREGSAALDWVVDLSARAAEAGVGIIQVRERGLDDRTLLRLVGRVVRAVEPSSARVVVNERVDVAIASGTHGVHLPADGVPAADARQLLAEGALVGRSIHSAAEAADVARVGRCDYLVFGTVYESGGKPAGHHVTGVEGLSAACAATRLPILAVGGITPDRFAEVAASGAAGFAAIGLFAEASSTADITRLLSRANGAFAAHTTS
jgi:thiamine-phosphate pyrophosphorylase